MPKMFSTDTNNDLFIAPNGNLAVGTNLFAVLQGCEHAVKAQLGEMVLSIDTGVPNFQTIWQNAANIPQFEAYCRAAIRGVDGVVEVKEFDAEVVDNRVRYVATIVTVYGVGDING